MAIEKYAIARNYGYGNTVLTEFWFEFDTSYIPEVYADSKIVGKTTIARQNCSDLNINTNNLIYLDDDIDVIPLYLVFDGETNQWREYFTGIFINYIEEDNLNNIWRIDADKYPDGYSGGFERSLSTIDIEIVTPTEFTEYITKYSNSDIQEIANQIYSFQKNAEKWSKALDKTIQSVKAKRAKKEAEASSIESKLKSGFGKYSIENITAKDEQTSSKSYSSQQYWISNGKCPYCGSVLGEKTQFKRVFKCKKDGKIKIIKRIE